MAKLVWSFRIGFFRYNFGNDFPLYRTFENKTDGRRRSSSNGTVVGHDLGFIDFRPAAKLLRDFGDARNPRLCPSGLKATFTKKVLLKTTLPHSKALTLRTKL